MIKNIFTPEVSNEIISRINKLTSETQPVWGKMNVAQMLAHCCVTYEMIYDDIHPKPSAFMKFILKALVKKTVVTDVPYKKNSRTAPQFLITDPRVFETEKARLIQYIQKTQNLGEKYFDKKESHSFGVLKVDEWNTMFYKHLNHHLSQFGV
ncbi:MAG TPA: DUF1569 domain-containing protein [Bacteroidia bacterium]|nr:DUF1569 domain-containing protein [Bacteroidia bacterium]HNP98076.1 DUF1569 domain-containing protein [Bacteroidia bacterium]